MNGVLNIFVTDSFVEAAEGSEALSGLRKRLFMYFGSTLSIAV